MSMEFQHAHWSIKLTCEGKSCHERARIRIGRVFATFARGPHGGTVKRPAFACKKCGHITAFRPELLPRGVFDTLPNRQQQMAGFARLIAHRNLRGVGDGWVRGHAAREQLTEALIRTDRMGAHCALVLKDGDAVEVPVDLKGISTSHALDRLDKMNCHVLVSVYLDKRGIQQTMAFHETSGAIAA